MMLSGKAHNLVWFLFNQINWVYINVKFVWYGSMWTGSFKIDWQFYFRKMFSLFSEKGITEINFVRIMKKLFLFCSLKFPVKKKKITCVYSHKFCCNFFYSYSNIIPISPISCANEKTTTFVLLQIRTKIYKTRGLFRKQFNSFW